MNFFPADVATREYQVTLSGSSFQIILSPQLTEHDFPERVLVGVRPEDLGGPVQEEQNSVQLRVSVLEQLGHTLLVYGYLDDTQIDLDSMIRLSVNTKALHVFDPDSKETVI